jgi:hypothetical protein
MWTDILGGIMALSGLVMAINPDKMRRKLKRIGVKTARRLCAAAAITAGGLLISAGWHETGWSQKGITGLGIVIVIKSIFFLKAKSGEVMLTKIQKIPTLYLRLLALAQSAFGLWLIMMHGQDPSA